MMNDAYIMRDPTSELTPVNRSRLDPPPSLNGLTVGLLSISKERSDEFMDRIAEQFSNFSIDVMRFKKPTHTKPAPEGLVQDLVEKCDVIVEALAD